MQWFGWQGLVHLARRTARLRLQLLYKVKGPDDLVCIERHFLGLDSTVFLIDTNLTNLSVLAPFCHFVRWALFNTVFTGCWKRHQNIVVVLCKAKSLFLAAAGRKLQNAAQLLHECFFNVNQTAATDLQKQVANLFRSDAILHSGLSGSQKRDYFPNAAQPRICAVLPEEQLTQESY